MCEYYLNTYYKDVEGQEQGPIESRYFIGFFILSVQFLSQAKIINKKLTVNKHQTSNIDI
ncbi:hypothetical protein PPYC2_13720 [Paenibacillus polymyxa]|nr:hypothetical protein PPYC2_13720 [Paenibacillus polymyxa]POR28712.1 hypothetical protein CG775_09160 [Paenibacillus polymyxa]